MLAHWKPTAPQTYEHVPSCHINSVRIFYCSSRFVFLSIPVSFQSYKRSGVFCLNPLGSFSFTLALGTAQVVYERTVRFLDYFVYYMYRGPIYACSIIQQGGTHGGDTLNVHLEVATLQAASDILSKQYHYFSDEKPDILVCLCFLSPSEVTFVQDGQGIGPVT